MSTLLEDLALAALVCDSAQGHLVAARLREHAERLRAMSLIEGGTTSVKSIIEMANGGPIKP